MFITQSLKRAMQVNGNGIATICGKRQQTWNEFGARVARLAGAFKDLGLSTDERVAILSLNSDRYLETFFATHWADGVIVPLNVRLAPPELIYMLNDAEVEILIQRGELDLPPYGTDVPLGRWHLSPDRDHDGRHPRYDPQV